MNDRFLDTNILLYLLSADERKADTAETLVAGSGLISVQVLNEAAAVCIRKLGMPWPEIREFLAGIRACCEVLPLTVDTHDRALGLAERYQLSFYDALICAAALEGNARMLLTEDMHDGATLAGLRICNPFAAP